MKLSQFQNTGIVKKIKFVNGEIIKEDKQVLNGEVTFYDLTMDKIREINDNIVQKLTGNEKDEYITYLMLPYLCDVEVDLSYEEFLDMMNEKPTKQFSVFLEELISVINELFEVANNINNIAEQTKELKEKVNEINYVESPQEEYMRLQNELMTTTDKERKKEIIKRLNELLVIVDE